MSKYVMLNFSKSIQMKTLIHLLLGWLEGEHILSTFSFLGDLFL